MQLSEGTGHTHQLTTTHMFMNIIKRSRISLLIGETPPQQAEVLQLKKTEKISTFECRWQWLPSWLLAINQSVAESTLPARLSDAVQITMFTTKLFMSQTELPGQQ